MIFSTVFDEYTLTDSLLVELIDNVMKALAQKDTKLETGKTEITKAIFLLVIVIYKKKNIYIMEKYKCTILS